MFFTQKNMTFLCLVAIVPIYTIMIFFSLVEQKISNIFGAFKYFHYFCPEYLRRT